MSEGWKGRFLQGLRGPREPQGSPPLPERFEQPKLLGSGGMGRVYQARDAQLGRTVAVKTLGPGPVPLLTEQRFRREGEALARLEHPGVVRVHELLEVDERLYLVMEHVIGQPLSERLREGALPREDALRLTLTLARALEAVHEAGVLHRDIKPANVVLRANGEPVLIDFGLARVEDVPGLTATGVVVGTPAYMPLEQRAGSKVDQRTDVYGLGRLLAELLAPGAWEDDPALPGLERGARKVVLEACAQLPEDRTPTAAALASHLEALLAQPARAQPPVAALLAVGLLLALALGGLRVLGDPPPEPARPQEPPAAKAPDPTPGPGTPTPRRERARTLPHPNVLGACFLPDGRAVTWTPAGQLKTWAEGRPASSALGAPLTALVALADGSLLALGPRGLARHRLERPESTRWVDVPSEGRGWFTLSVDEPGSRCVVASRSAGVVVLSLPGFQRECSLGTESETQAVALGPSGRTVAVATGHTTPDRTSGLALFSLPDGRSLGRWPLAIRPRTVAISRDERWIASGDQAGHVHLVDTTTGKVQRLGGVEAGGLGGAHDGRVRRVAFGPGVLYSLSGESELRSRQRPNTVRRWVLAREARSGDPILETSSELWDLAVAPGGEAILVVDRSRAEVRRLPAGG